jgi:hypothetical protein
LVRGNAPSAAALADGFGVPAAAGGRASGAVVFAKQSFTKILANMMVDTYAYTTDFCASRVSHTFYHVCFQNNVPHTVS